MAPLFVDVLPTATGVNALLGWTRDGEDEALHDRSVMFNDGSGWLPVFEGPCGGGGGSCSDQCIGHLAGEVGGWVVGWSGCDPGPGTLGTMVRVGPGVQENWPSDAPRVSDVFVVRDDLAYAIWPGVEVADTKILTWDGSAWSPVRAELPLPYRTVAHLWADNDDVFVVGDRGTALSLESDAWFVHDVGTMSNLTSVWGFDGDDVWVGSDVGELFHYDGVAWTEQSWSTGPGAECETDPVHSIETMSGAGDTLFFGGNDIVVRWNGDFEVLGHWPGTRSDGSSCSGRIRIMRVRATAPSSVFIAALQMPADVLPLPCQTGFLLYWDGTTFHWM